VAIVGKLGTPKLEKQATKATICLGVKIYGNIKLYYEWLVTK
jgi:hypothetical protein